MLRINIIGLTNEFGKKKDISLIKSSLEATGCFVTINGPAQHWKNGIAHTKRSFKRSIKFKFYDYLSRVSKRKPYDVNIFIERVWPEWYKMAQINCLIPNQEWFPKKDLNNLVGIDFILCKTRLAESIFKKYARTKFISFTSRDRFQEKFSKNYDRFLHVAGGSLQKGTHRILKIWKKHPEWPLLTIVQDLKNAEEAEAKNINYIKRYIEEEKLIELQNISGVHLCPSRSEGFGHYINEAMSCRSLVVTTDAPPMNELIQSQRGFLVKSQLSDASHTNNVGLNYYFDSADFEDKISRILKLSRRKQERFGLKAREWFNQNDSLFKANINSLVGDFRNIID